MSFFRRNGLSVVLILLFAVFLGGQTWFGWKHFNEENEEHGQPGVSLLSYLGSGAFGEAVFENWESEFLQMGLYVMLTAFLFQKGSAESKDPEEKPEGGSSGKDFSRAPGPVRRGGWALFLYSHSLSIAFLLLFAISFTGHLVCGTRAFNEEALAHGQPTVTIGQYLVSSQFWFESFQNWQSEFLAIFAIVVLSIWLREKGSPESKPVEAPHEQTGG